MVKKPKTSRGKCKIGRHEEQAVATIAYETDSVNQELLVQNEYLAAENRILRAKLPSRIAVGRSRARYPRRNREAPGAQGATRARLHREARHHSGLVSETDRLEVRRLQTPAISGPAQDPTRAGSAGGPDGAGRFRMELRPHRWRACQPGTSLVGSDSWRGRWPSSVRIITANATTKGKVTNCCSQSLASSVS